MRFLKHGKLEDKKIEIALRKAADDYANGELIEVRDVLYEIINAIVEFEDIQEQKAYKKSVHRLEKYVDLEEQAKKNGDVMNRVFDFITEDLQK